MSEPNKSATKAANPNQPLPPDEKFWQSYSKHFEFPLSTIGSIAAHVFVFAFLVLLLKYAMNGKDKSSVPIRIVAVPEGAEIGDGGSEGAIGGQSEGREDVKQPTKEPASDLAPEIPQLQAPETVVSAWLPEFEDNPDALNQFAQNEQVKNFSKMQDAIASKLRQGVQKRNNNPNGNGTSAENGAGTGTGGTGGSTTAKRIMRWTLRFNTKNGRDYLDQLDMMGAVLMIPQPPDWKSAKIIRDLKTPNAGKEEDLTQFAQMQFTDTRPDSVRDVAVSLGLDFTPQYFTAFFPREFEEDLARKEKAYRGLREEEIAETVFQIVVRNRKTEVTVVEQRRLQRK